MGAALGGEEWIPEKSPANRATAMLGGRERHVFAAGHTIAEATPGYANSGSDGGDQVFYPNPSPLPLLQMGFAGGWTLGWTLRVGHYGKAGRETSWAGQKCTGDVG